MESILHVMCTNHFKMKEMRHVSYLSDFVDSKISITSLATKVNIINIPR